MHIIPSLLIVLIAALHAYILYLEMFAWDKPRTRKAFQMEEEFAKATKPMAANQGLYNGFLAAGLFWGVVSQNVEFAVFFLLCVMVAGIYGSQTVMRKILFIQTVPAVIALVALFVF